MACCIEMTGIGRNQLPCHNIVLALVYKKVRAWFGRSLGVVVELCCIEAEGPWRDSLGLF